MATTANVILLPGIQAAADLSAKQYLWVKMSSTAGQVKAVSATTDLALGILTDKPAAAGRAAAVQVGGIAKLFASTSVGWTNGIAVGWNTTGQGVPLAANSTNDNRPIGGRFHIFDSDQSTVLKSQLIRVQMFSGVQRL